jgi:hypothetical protein
MKTRTKTTHRTLPLGRRTFLRGALASGAAAAVGLPLLEAMGPGTAHAGGMAPPDRFLLWFFGNGVRPEHWVPGATGADYPLSAELAPLAPVKPWVSVVSGCEIKTATHPHHSGMTGILTGRHYEQVGTTRDTIVSTFAAPSVDQQAKVALPMAPGGFASLELGVTRFRGTDEGTTFQHLSHNGPNAPNPSEYSAGAVYRRLFAVPVEDEVLAARRSVLSAVSDQIRTLEGRVGRSDRLRLEQHYESVRALETRLSGMGSTCVDPGDPGDVVDAGGREQIATQNQVMSDLAVLALSCDMTRVLSMFFSTAGSGVILWPVGATNGFHQLNHDEAPPHATVHAGVVYTMEQLAYFLTRLRDTPEGPAGENLLDHLSMLVTSELTEGWTHSNRDFPILVVGKGNGRLRGNVHHRSPSLENTSHAVLTALQGAGCALGSYGDGPGYVDRGFDTLRT